MLDTPLKTFIIYARNDKAHKDELLSHLKPLVAAKMLDLWHDGDMNPGEEWEIAIKKNLKASEIILILVSKHCLNSDFIQTEELEAALLKMKDGSAQIVPIIVSPCMWKLVPIFNNLQCLPEDAKPITTWSDKDEAWTDVAEGILKTVEHIQVEKAEIAAEKQAEIAQKEAERLEKERLEKLSLEQKEKERLAKIAADKWAEEQRLAKIAADKQAEIEKQEKEHLAKIAAEKAEKERLERLAFEEKERERLAVLAAQKQEQERLDKIAAEKVEKERLEKMALEKQERERLAKIAAEKERLEKAEKSKREWERVQQAERSKREWERAAEKQAKEQQERENSYAVSPQNSSLPKWIGAGVGTFLVIILAITQPWKTGTATKNNNVASMESTITHLDKDPFEGQMVAIPAGTFMMGSNEGEADEKPVHKISLSAFQIGKYEVTQKQWKAIMGANPSHFKDCDDCPVESVSWNDVQVFLKKLNELTGKKYRLPTEAEWEFAARGGNKSKGYTYAGSNTAGDVAHYGAKNTQPVAQKSPNELGLYDMSGNVYEWTSAKWAAYPGGKGKVDACEGCYVLRGGSWNLNSRYVRVAFRNRNYPTSRSYYNGFRLGFGD